MSNAPDHKSEYAGTAPVEPDQYLNSVSLIKRCLLVTAVFLITLVSLLLFTHTGNTLLWRQLINALPALDGELAEGQLMTGWNIKNLRWQDSQIAFQADDITLKWQLGKLLTRQLPIQLLEIEGGNLEIQPTVAATEPSAPTTPDTTLNFPLDILINQIHIQDFDVTFSGTTVSLDTFAATVRIQNSQLFIPEVRADNLQIVLIGQQSATSTPKALTPNKQTSAGIDLSRITLPEIKLPMPISLENFTLTNARYQQGDIDETLKALELSFNWQATHITHLKLKAEQTRANILVNGEIQLSESYPLSLNLDATLLDDFNIPGLTAIKGDKLSLEASGDLSQLQLRLATRGSINTTLEGNIGLFAPNFPLSVALKWPELQWPLQENEPGVSVGNGLARITGNLNQYQLSLDTSINVAKQPATQLSLVTSGSLQQLNIEALSLSPADESNLSEKPLELTGTINWKDGIHWQGHILLSKLQPELWLRDLPGRLSGKVTTQFIMADGSWQLSIPELIINGSLLNNPLELTGKLASEGQVRPMAALPFKVNIHRFYAALGENRLNISGQIAEQLSLSAKLDAKSLDMITPDLKGSLHGSVKLSGSDKHPKLSFSFDSPSIDVQQTSINRLQVNGELTRATLLEGKTTVEADSVNSGNIQLKNLLLIANGSERNHQISLKTQGEPVAGELQINGVWQGAHGNSRGKWQGQLASARVITPLDTWSLEQPVTIGLNASDETVKLTDQCWLAKPARLCIDASTFSANHGTTRFRLSDFNLSTLKPLLPGNLNWQAILSGSGNIQWDSGQPIAHIQIQTTPGEVTSNSDNSASVNYQKLSTVINLKEDNLQAEFDFDSKQLGFAHINLAIDNMHSDQTLSGQARLQDMRLYFLQPLIPDISHIDGILSADTRMGGTLKEPLLFGNLKLRAGRLAAKQEMVKVSHLITELNVVGNKAEVSGRMKIDDGDMKLSGHLDWQQLPPSGVIDIKGQNLGARVPGILQLRASPDLRLTIGEAQTLTGNITIPWARASIKQLPGQAVTPSDDVVIITPGTRKTLLPAGPPFTMDVNVVLGKDIKIDAYGLKSDLGGQLLLNLQPGKPMTADGSIQLTSGRYHQFGQDLLIKEGNIIFSGPLSSPYLAVNAIRNPESIEGDVSVGIQVRGAPSRPEFSIYSDPSLPQQEQWSYLLRGRGLEDGDNSAVQTMLIGFGVSQFGGVVTSIGEKIGFSDVTLDTQGSGDDTRVTIGGTIAPGLRVQYGAGVFNSIAEVKVRYELMPRLYLQAISGLAQAIDLFYQFKIETGNHKN
ncbi:translocation/assembly module TamB domain-containing protein [Endozoicomonas sp. YOMI1]|uniref:autotransporter assembly complex protein TamB n=1 Tax=Endozoicomonas sp. YOMI1 TaxID=2828739 RepID=UPI00214941E4|nr:translocation/assembly module TamB domain-containing protein [Endozoicomonas sp. YOMI1]